MPPQAASLPAPAVRRGSQPAPLAQRVFDGHPHGLLVVAPDGAVVAHNGAVRRLLGALAPRLDRAAPGLACELLGCRRSTSPLGDVCLTQRALHADGPLPEVRLDLPAGSGVRAVWATAARLGPPDPAVVVELRPAQAGDRRRRTETHRTRGPQLRVFVLGRTRVESAEGPIDGAWLDNRPGQLLKLLVAERRRSVFPDEVAESLWPGSDARSVQRVRYFVHDLRERLEPGRSSRAPSSFIRFAQGGYGLDLQRVSIDADDFERDIAAGLRQLAAGEPGDAAESLERGLERYAGDFLADEPYAAWAVDERERLRSLAADGLSALADLREGTGDLPGASAALERLAGLDPLDADVHRRFFAVLMRRGRRTEALRRYTALRHRMLSVFGEDLDFTLTELTLGC